MASQQLGNIFTGLTGVFLFMVLLYFVGLVVKALTKDSE